jgi:protein gp37
MGDGFLTANSTCCQMEIHNGPRRGSGPLWRIPHSVPVRHCSFWIADLSDLFLFPDDVITHAIATIVQSGHITLLLTKRTARMAAYFASLDPRTVRRWQPQLWLGFSAERQREFDLRWPDMRALAEAGWFVFVSIAPLLAPVTLPPDFLALAKWVIVAGEQKIPRTPCRPMKPAWARAIRNQCRAANIPFFLKQMANGAPRPPDLQIRQFPSVA